MINFTKKIKLFTNNYLIKIKSNYSTGYNIKHHPSASKEWKDSLYSYNKNYLKYSFIRNNTADNLIKSHFYLSNLKNIGGSKRIRNLMIKKSSKKIFLSKPSIKHSNDKIIINIYTFNRQKELLMRKLFLYKNNYNSFIKKIYANNLFNKQIVTRKKSIIIRYKVKFNKIATKFFPFSGIKYKNELSYVKYKSLNLYKRFTYFNNIFIFMFLRKLLYFFNIDLFMPFFINKKSIVKNINNLDNIMFLNKKNNKLELINRKLIKENTFRYDYKDLITLNKSVLHFIEEKLINTGIINESDLINMYIRFKTKYYTRFITKFFKEKRKILFYIKALELNNLKYSKYLYNLKILIARIYNKKVELNITNLKYPFLNSEIYGKIIADKAIKRMSFTKILGYSLNLSKIPSKIFFRKKENLKLNNYSFINSYNNVSLNKMSIEYNYNKDKLNTIFNNVYPNQFINKNPIIKSNKFYSNKINSILNTIKFKWVSGVWLEGAGRLSRRYTASRSLLAIRNKGNLKNKQYRIENNVLEGISTIMIRNTVKSNSQYGYTKSKRRIGAFGIKTWISSY